MNFNPDPNKQVQEVAFSRKINQINHPLLLFNQNLVKSSSTKKHLGMILDNKLDFSLHLKNVERKVNKTITLIRTKYFTKRIVNYCLQIIYKASSRLRKHIRAQ